MRKVMISIAATAAALVAANPANAQWSRGYDQPGYGRSYDPGYAQRGENPRLRQIAFMIERGERSGSLDRREVRSLRDELRDIQRMDARMRYSGYGYDRGEMYRLDQRIDRLEYRLRRAQFADNRFGRFGDRDHRDYDDRDGRHW